MGPLENIEATTIDLDLSSRDKSTFFWEKKTCFRGQKLLAKASWVSKRVHLLFLRYMSILCDQVPLTKCS